MLMTLENQYKIQRRFTPKNHSYFLFGPRGTGKSTFLREQQPHSLYVDLLKNNVFLKYQSDLELLQKEVNALANDSWVIVDEIQRLPELLNEIHSLLSEKKKKINFILSGSSARKLKKTGANLLAGRALSYQFFPFTQSELKQKFDLDRILKLGLLPEIYLSSDDIALDMLDNYVGTYLQEEVRQEALVRRLDLFARFLEVAAIMNGQVLNLNNIARDAGVKRPTLQGFFEVACDTLLTYTLPAWQPRAKVKEKSHPKLYFFDTGVVRALSKKQYSPISDYEKGYLFETYLLHEIRSYIHDAFKKVKMFYYLTDSDSEIDLVLETADSKIGIEIKSSTNWRPGFSNTLNEMVDRKFLNRAYGVYLGTTQLKDGHVHVLPLQEFLSMLYQGKMV